jgi:hypothetical protein
MIKLKKPVFILLTLIVGMVISGCKDGATIAGKNLSKEADNFEINRRIMFVNTRTDTKLLIIEGRCNIEYWSSRTHVICKVSDNRYKRSFIGNNGQITAIVEQLDGVPVNVYHYRRTFKPQSFIPDIDFIESVEAKVDSIGHDKTDYHPKKLRIYSL